MQGCDASLGVEMTPPWTADLRSCEVPPAGREDRLAGPGPVDRLIHGLEGRAFLECPDALLGPSMVSGATRTPHSVRYGRLALGDGRPFASHLGAIGTQVHLSVKDIVPGRNVLKTRDLWVLAGNFPAGVVRRVADFCREICPEGFDAESDYS